MAATLAQTSERRVPAYSPLPSSIALGNRSQPTDYARLHREEFEAPPLAAYDDSPARAPKGEPRTKSFITFGTGKYEAENFTLASSAILDRGTFDEQALKREPASVQNNVTSKGTIQGREDVALDYSTAAGDVLRHTISADKYVESTHAHLAEPVTGHNNASSPGMIRCMKRAGHEDSYGTAQREIFDHRIEPSAYATQTQLNHFYSPAAIAAREKPLSSKATLNPSSQWSVAEWDITRKTIPAELYAASTHVNVAAATEKSTTSVAIGHASVKTDYTTTTMASNGGTAEDYVRYKTGQPYPPPLARNARYVTDHPALSPSSRTATMTGTGAALASSPGSSSSPMRLPAK
jgi:hypothetical protein